VDRPWGFQVLHLCNSGKDSSVRRHDVFHRSLLPSSLRNSLHVKCCLIAAINRLQRWTHLGFGCHIVGVVLVRHDVNRLPVVRSMCSYSARVQMHVVSSASVDCSTVYFCTVLSYVCYWCICSELVVKCRLLDHSGAWLRSYWRPIRRRGVQTSGTCSVTRRPSPYVCVCSCCCCCRLCRL